MAYIDHADTQKVADQVIAAAGRLSETGFPQTLDGEAALRARALEELLAKIVDRMKAEGLMDGGLVPPDVDLISRLRSEIDTFVGEITRGPRT